MEVECIILAENIVKYWLPHIIFTKPVFHIITIEPRTVYIDFHIPYPYSLVGIYLS